MYVHDRTKQSVYLIFVQVYKFAQNVPNSLFFNSTGHDTLNPKSFQDILAKKWLFFPDLNECGRGRGFKMNRQDQLSEIGFRNKHGLYMQANLPEN